MQTNGLNKKCGQLVSILHPQIHVRMLNQKQTEEQIEIGADDYLQLFDIVPFGLVYINSDGKIVHLNSKAAQLFNREAHICEGSKFTDFLEDKSVIEVNNSICSLSEDKKNMRCTLLLKDDKSITYYVKTNIYSMRDGLILLVLNNISNQKVKETVLIKAKEKAESADKMKTSFLANVSHEIRTPLNSIIGFSELLLNKLTIDSKSAKLIEVIYRNSKNLLHLISDIIDISRIDAKEVKLNREICSLEALLFDLSITSKISTKKAGKEHISIHIERPQNLMNTKIYADESKIKQVFQHLIENAVKFTAKGNICIGFDIETTHDKNNKDLIRFYVKDTGIGISDDKKKLIFKHFRQIDESTTRSYGGTGLGLAICKGLVELMGGKIWVESKLNEGSQFNFTIPYIPALLKNGETIEFHENNEIFYDLEQQHILIVGDNEYSSAQLVKLITVFNAQVDIVYSGAKAIEFCRHQKPNLVILDSILSDGKGYEVLADLKEKYPNLKGIIQVSDNLDESELTNYCPCCDAYIQIPAEARTVYKIIDRVLNQ